MGTITLLKKYLNVQIVKLPSGGNTVMKIIPFEGLDKSGKATQVKLLQEGLEKEGFKVAVSEFHQYDSPTGAMIKAYLKGEIEMNTYALECIIAADKYNMVHQFNQWRHDGVDVLLLDRYVLSSLAYALNKEDAVSDQWLLGIIEHLPEPDFHVYLDVPAEVSMARKGKHGENDRYESDLEYLKRVRQYYLDVVNHLNNETPGSAVIVNGEGTVEDVAHEILEGVLQFLHESSEEPVTV
jgi:dTMP kinase